MNCCNPRVPEELRIAAIGFAVVVPLAYFLRKWSDRNASQATGTTTPPAAPSGALGERDWRC